MSVAQEIEQGIAELVMKSYQKGNTSEVISDFMDIPLEKVQDIIGKAEIEKPK